jgi:ABC-type Co2+ transport system permease subunit
MAIINRRNAVFGWSVWQVAKRIGKKKARDAVPGTGDHAGLNKSAIATIVAAIGGALFFWRKKSDGETTAP